MSTKILFIPGSLRKDSFNTKLLGMAASYLNGTENVVDAADVNLPLYNEDIEKAGIPPAVQNLANRIKEADAIVIASPEYNYSISGVLKNFIDWLSRVRPLTFTDKPVLLMSTSSSDIAGIRGLWQTRIPLEGLGNHVFPNMFSLGDCFNAFEGNKLKQADANERFVATLNEFKAHLKKYKCECGANPGSMA